MKIVIAIPLVTSILSAIVAVIMFYVKKYLALAFWLFEPAIWVYSTVYGLLTGIPVKEIVESLSPEPETEYEKIMRIVDQYYRAHNVVVLQIAIVLLSIVVAWMARSYARRASMYMKGVKYESMVAGSSLSPGKLPKGQIEIKMPGVFRNVFSGYGLLHPTKFLIVPLHVILDAQEIIVGNGKEEWLIPVSRITSRIHQDVAYIPLTTTVFNKLRTAFGLVKLGKFKPALMNCTGRGGQSSGFVRKSACLGVIIYEGSTLPGMSGAAYWNGNQVYGMHTGVSGDYNVGVVATLFHKELKQLVTMKPESHNPLNDNIEIGYKTRFRHHGWSDEDLDEQLEYPEEDEDNWAAQDEFGDDFYDQELDFDVDYEEKHVRNARLREEAEEAHWRRMGLYDPESAIDPLTFFDGKDPQVIANYIRTGRTLLMAQKKVEAKGQSPDGDFVQLPEHYLKLKIGQLEGQVRLLEEKVAILSSNVDQMRKNQEVPVVKSEKNEKVEKKKKEPAGPVHPFPCDQCKGVIPKSFKTEAALFVHKIDAHKDEKSDAKGETAYNDTKKAVKTKGKAFLEKRSPKRIKGSSSSTSNGSEQSKLFQSILESQKSMQDTLQKLLITLSGTVQATNGQSSGESQS